MRSTPSRSRSVVSSPVHEVNDHMRTISVILALLATCAFSTDAGAQTSITLNPGDTYRITFTVDPAAFSPGFVPDGGVLVSHLPSSTQCTGAFFSQVYDGYRLLGQTDPPSARNCGQIFRVQPPPGSPDYFIDPASILSGSIYGHVDLKAASFSQFTDGPDFTQGAWFVLLCSITSSQPPFITQCRANGVSIVSRRVIKAPTIPRPVVPVVFVHGTCSDNTTWTTLVNSLRSSGWRFGGYLTDEVTLAGLDPDPSADFYVVQFTNDKEILSGLDGWALRLNLYLRNLSKHRTGVASGAKFIVVAHSAGGLAARHYLQSLLYVNNVYHLITYGTPHQGIPFSGWDESLLQLSVCRNGLASLFLSSAGFAQMNDVGFQQEGTLIGNWLAGSVYRRAESAGEAVG